MRHGSNFDWVVAHIGSTFPETIITRVLAVGLKELCGYAQTQVKIRLITGISICSEAILC